MSFFSDLSETIAEPPQAVRLRHLGATTDVLKYAPPRLRAETIDRAKAQADIAYWRERAFKAETKLRTLETRVHWLAGRAQGVRR
ncbi:MAG: hypothetical protein GC182_06765 [Rhodopseudomonas sp.]|nr:hypothetical protein [Rhodopseudomonas sp.]